MIKIELTIEEASFLATDYYNQKLKITKDENDYNKMIINLEEKFGKSIENLG